MKVLTKNPIVLNGNDISPRDYYSNATSDVAVDFDYLPTEEISADDVKVITKYPIVLDGNDISPRDYYSNLPGDETITLKPKPSQQLPQTIYDSALNPDKKPSKSTQDEAKKRGLFWDNAKKSWQAFSQSEAGKMALAQLDAALTARREARFGAGQGGGFTQTDTNNTQKDEEMSLTTKILLIGGGLIVVGLIIYSAFSSKSAPAAK